MKESSKNKFIFIKSLKFLSDEKTREEYIKLTNPKVKPLLLNRPKIIRLK